MKNSAIIILFLCVFLFFATCETDLNTPLSKQVVEAIFDEYHDSLCVVAEFVENSDYEHLSIDKPNGTIFADFETVILEDAAVADAVACLFEDKIVKKIYMYEDTVVFLIWTGVADITCGLAFQLNPDIPIYVQFLTELKPLSQEKWYYYVEDYELWRATKK